MDTKRYTTHKNTALAKQTTKERKRVKAVKRTPNSEDSLRSLAIQVNARYVA